MTQQTINTGTAANDRKGDSLRAAFTKINANFTELYSSTGGGADTGNFRFNNNFLYTQSNQEIWIDPSNDEGSTGFIYIPGPNEANVNLLQIGNQLSGGVQISSNDNNWIFRSDGALKNNYSFTKTSQSNIATTDPTVIWTASEDYISGAKLMIQVEASENGDTTGWHSQVCEAVIASRGYASTYGGPGGDPAMTVYSVTYTSTSPLVTFSVQRDPTTKKIKVLGTLTAATNPTNADLRIYSVETATRD